MNGPLSLEFLAQHACMQILLSDRVGGSVLQLLETECFGAVSEALLQRIVKYAPGKLSDRMLVSLVTGAVKELNLSKCYHVTLTGLAHALNRCPHLHYLRLKHCSQLICKEIFEFMGLRQLSVTHLSLENTGNLDDKMVHVLMSSLPHLTTLNLSNNSQLTDKAFLIHPEEQRAKELGRSNAEQAGGFTYRYSLTSVDVSACRGLSKIAILHLTSLCGPRLKHINLSWTSIGCESLLFLAGYSLSDSTYFLVQKLQELSPKEKNKKFCAAVKSMMDHFTVKSMLEDTRQLQQKLGTNKGIAQEDSSADTTTDHGIDSKSDMFRADDKNFTSKELGSNWEDTPCGTHKMMQEGKADSADVTSQLADESRTHTCETKSEYETVECSEDISCEKAEHTQNSEKYLNGATEELGALNKASYVSDSPKDTITQEETPELVEDISEKPHDSELKTMTSKGTDSSVKNDELDVEINVQDLILTDPTMYETHICEKKQLADVEKEIIEKAPINADNVICGDTRIHNVHTHTSMLGVIEHSESIKSGKTVKVCSETAEDSPINSAVENLELTQVVAGDFCDKCKINSQGLTIDDTHLMMSDFETDSESASIDLESSGTAGHIGLSDICCEMVENNNHTTEMVENNNYTTGIPVTLPLCDSGVEMPACEKEISESLKVLEPSLNLDTEQLSSVSEKENGTNEASYKLSSDNSQKPEDEVQVECDKLQTEDKNCIRKSGEKDSKVGSPVKDNSKESLEDDIEAFLLEWSKIRQSNEDIKVLTPEFESNLVSLDITNIEFSDKCLGALCMEKFFEINKKLQKFSITWKGLTGQLMQRLTRSLGELREIDVVECTMLASEGVQAVGLGCPKLEKINFKGVDFFGDYGLRPVLDLAFLTTLCVAGSEITDVSLCSLSEKQAGSLTQLDLSWCEETISEKGINAVCEKCKKLEVLYLPKCPVSDVTLALMSESCQKMSDLSFQCVDNFTFDTFSMSGLMALASHLTNLKRLDISWNLNVTDEGISAILVCCAKLEVAIMSGIKTITVTPFLPIIAGYESKNGQDVPEMNLDNLCAGGILTRSSTYAPCLRKLYLEYCDLVDEHQLLKVVQACNGTLTALDYYGEVLT